MGMTDECEMLVDELRDDQEFRTSLTCLRDAITEAITATDTRSLATRFRDVAKWLVQIVNRLDSQR